MSEREFAEHLEFEKVDRPILKAKQLVIANTVKRVNQTRRETLTKYQDDITISKQLTIYVDAADLRDYRTKISIIHQYFPSKYQKDLHSDGDVALTGEWRGYTVYIYITIDSEKRLETLSKIFNCTIGISQETTRFKSKNYACKMKS